VIDRSIARDFPSHDTMTGHVDTFASSASNGVNVH